MKQALLLLLLLLLLVFQAVQPLDTNTLQPSVNNTVLDHG